MYIATICSPFPSHLGQFANVLRELAARGHRLELWGDDFARLAAERLGLGFGAMSDCRDIAAAAESCRTAEQYYRRCAFPLARRQLKDILRLCRSERPDLLHANTRVYAAALASRITGIPVSNHCGSGLSFGLIPEDLFGFGATGSEPTRKTELMLALNRRFHRRMDRLFAQIVGRPLRLPRIVNILGLTSTRCVLVFSVKELATPRLADLPYARFTGPCLVHGQARPVSGSPYCYLSLGTWPQDRALGLAIYRGIIAGIPRRFRVMIGLGGRYDPAEIDNDGGRVVAQRYAPQVSLISKSELVLCHGGCQTVHEALYWAKPVIAVPSGYAEPTELVRKVQRAGVGLAVEPGAIGPGLVTDAIERILADKSTARRAVALSRALRAAGGTSGAADAIEKVFTQEAERVG